MIGKHFDGLPDYRVSAALLQATRRVVLDMAGSIGRCPGHSAENRPKEGVVVRPSIWYSCGKFRVMCAPEARVTAARSCAVDGMYWKGRVQWTRDANGNEQPSYSCPTLRCASTSCTIASDCAAPPGWCRTWSVTRTIPSWSPGAVTGVTPVSPTASMRWPVTANESAHRLWCSLKLRKARPRRGLAFVIDGSPSAYFIFRLGATDGSSCSSSCASTAPRTCTGWTVVACRPFSPVSAA